MAFSKTDFSLYGTDFSALPIIIGVASIFAKADEFTFLKLSTNAFGFQASYFDLVNGTFVEGADHIAKIEDYGNGWYRCSIYVSEAFTQFYVENAGNSASATHLGDGTSGIYIWGAQVEADSYPTSYIPTNGGTVTRSAETCNGAGDANTFNDSEGVFMFEGSKIEDDGVNTNITISDGTNNNRILISIGFQSKIGANIIVGNSSQSSYTTDYYSVDDFNKIAFSYKLNEFKLFINGINMYTDTNGLVFPYGTLNKLHIASGTGLGSPFYGNTKQIQYFDTALTDTDLETLTSWTSFNEMAQTQLYKTY